jgi:hypothetical protein
LQPECEFDRLLVAVSLTTTMIMTMMMLIGQVDLVGEPPLSSAAIPGEFAFGTNQIIPSPS